MILDRRRFLTAVGLAGMGAGLRPVASWGQAAEPPKRLIVLSSGHGTPYEHWRMRPTNQPDAGTWTADLRALQAGDFSRSLAPLHPHRNRLSVFDGLSMATAELDLPGYRHEKGWLHAWTGSWAYFTGSDLFSTQPSLDQLVARAIARPDRVPSLELQIDSGRPICHAGEAQQLPLEADPRRAWERLFGLATSDDPLLGAQASVLDFVKAEHEALRPKLSAGDQQRLDTHFELVRQLEQRLVGLASATCDSAGAAAPTLSLANYNQNFDAFAELITAAFSCDMTRVVALSLGDLPSDDFGWGHYLSGDAHNDFAHRIFEDPLAAEAMSDYTAHHAAQVARLVAALEAIPEGDGSLMDHTLIVWGSELADGWHGFEKYCTLIVGGSWALPGGTYHHWPFNSTPISMVGYDAWTQGSGLPHQHLLVTVAQAMGLDVDHVGLREVTTPDGIRVDLTGGLPL